MVKKKELIQTVVGTVTSLGVGTIVGFAVKAIIPPGLGLLTTGLVTAGKFVLTAMGGEVAEDWSNQLIDDISESLSKAEIEKTEDI